MFVAWIHINVGTSYHKLVSIIILLNEYYDFHYDDVHFHLLLQSLFLPMNSADALLKLRLGMSSIESVFSWL